MATAITIITDALLEIGVIGENETPSSEMANTTFRALNRLMEMWSNDSSFAYYASTVSRALTGESSFTVGPTGDVVTDRPISIETATVDRNGITYPVEVVDNQKWDLIAYKGAAGANTGIIYYEATMPNGIVHVWPIATGCTLNCRVLNVVDSFADLNTALIMPPGYEQAIIKALAIDVAPSFRANVSPLTLKAAKAAMKRINRTNTVIPTLQIDSSLLNHRGGSIAAFMGGY